MTFTYIKKPYIFLFALLCSITLSACLSTSVFQSKSSEVEQAPPINQEVMTKLSHARYAWELGNMERAESLYGQISTETVLTSGEKVEAVERFALAATYNKDYATGLKALNQWAMQVPSAKQSSRWQAAWLVNVYNLSSSKAKDEALAIWNNKNNPSNLQAYAATILMAYSDANTQNMQSLQLISSVYATQGVVQKQNLERIMANSVSKIDDTRLLELNQQLLDSSFYSFPANILLLEDGKRGLGLDSNLLAQLQSPALYACPNFAQKMISGQSLGAVTLNMKDVTSTQSANTSSSAPINSSSQNQPTCLVLALPQSGNISNVSQKIQSGANVAMAELNSQGKKIQIKTINTAGANWLNELQALPPQCALVGGTILAQNFTKAKTNGATMQRNFFAFLPSLDGTDEGLIAWRFFPSPQDQVQAVIKFSQNLGINDFGSFFPADPYGTRMNGIFASTVRANGGTVRAEGYVGAEQAKWNTAAKSLLQPSMVENKPQSQAKFSAIFLPDSWKNTDGIVNALASQGGSKQLLLGTSIWGQSLSNNASIANTNKFKLAIFPSSFNPENTAIAGINDTWTALGYDFVQLGAKLALTSKVPSNMLNGRLQNMQANKAMATIRYNAQGKASQDLFVLSINENGVGLADIDEISKRRSAPQ